MLKQENQFARLPSRASEANPSHDAGSTPPQLFTFQFGKEIFICATFPGFPTFPSLTDRVSDRRRRPPTRTSLLFPPCPGPNGSAPSATTHSRRENSTVIWVRRWRTWIRQILTTFFSLPVSFHRVEHNRLDFLYAKSSFSVRQETAPGSPTDKRISDTSESKVNKASWTSAYSISRERSKNK